jgi:hypothetical protein
MCFETSVEQNTLRDRTDLRFSVGWEYLDTAWLEEQRLQPAQCLVFISVEVLFNELAEIPNFVLVAHGSLQHGIADQQRPGLAALFEGVNQQLPVTRHKQGPKDVAICDRCISSCMAPTSASFVYLPRGSVVM